MSARPALEGMVEDVRTELAGVDRAIRSHRFLAALEAGAVDRERLREFAGAQRAILASDRRSFAQLAARFPDAPAGDLFLALGQGEGEALGRLAPLCAALGADERWLAAYEPPPGVQAYPSFMAWLALNGARADAALSLLVNLDAWGANCNRAAAALRARYRLEEEALGFFRFFGEPSPGLRRSALIVLAEGLADGDPEAPARWAARMLQACELAFWDAMVDAAPDVQP